MARTGAIALACFVLALAAESSADLTPFVHPAAAGEQETLLGFAVAATADEIAAGAPHTSVSGHVRAGAVHLLTADGRLLRTLVSPTPTGDANFGFAVAMDERYLLVGAPTATVNGHELAGAAYLFEHSTGHLLRRFLEPRPAARREFGLTVALDRGQVAIGSPGSTARGVAHAGAVYVFAVDDGSLRRQLTATRPRLGEGYAQALALAGRALVVGAPFATVAGLEKAGAVDVFDARSGQRLRRLHAPTPRAGAHFGAAVDLTGSLLLVGAPNPSDPGDVGGRAYLMRTRTGALLHTLGPPRLTASRQLFGYAVALSRASALVGAPDTTRGGVAKAGAAYLFDAGTGELRRHLEEPTPTALSQFGLSVDLARTAPIIGAQRARLTPGGGAVYLERRTPRKARAPSPRSASRTTSASRRTPSPPGAPGQSPF